MHFEYFNACRAFLGFVRSLFFGFLPIFTQVGKTFIFPDYSASNGGKKSMKKIMFITCGHGLHFMVGSSPVITIIPGMILAYSRKYDSDLSHS